MAGDWMKVELELPDKPEVHYIAGVINKDPEWVVGALIKVWGWFNKHTTDGNANGVTFALVDRYAGVEGFGEAMMFAGWLVQNGSVLTMPKFDRHTSESAKTRALAAERQSKYRNANSNGVSVTTTSPREEKRREEKQHTTPDGFDAFWSAYPKKVGKGAAEVAWKKAKVNGHLSDVLSAIDRQKRSAQWTKDNGQFIPNPATWINQRRWEDDLSSATNKTTVAI